MYPKLYAYNDYRSFLKDIYIYKKAKEKYFTYSFFAQKAGLSSPNYYKLVMDGQRNLTHKNVKKFCKGLALDKNEAHFFENLVFYNQAEEIEEKDFFKKNLETLLASVQKTKLEKDQYEVLSSCFPLMVKELLLLENQDIKTQEIAKRLNYAISPTQAQAILKLLLRLRLIKKTKQGYQPTSVHLETPDRVLADAAYQYHQHSLELAKKALNEQDDKERCFSSLCVAIDKKDLDHAFEMIHEFRNKMDQMFTHAKKYDAVYQLCISLFRADHDV